MQSPKPHGACERGPPVRSMQVSAPWAEKLRGCAVDRGDGDMCVADEVERTALRHWRASLSRPEPGLLIESGKIGDADRAASGDDHPGIDQGPERPPERGPAHSRQLSQLLLRR